MSRTNIICVACPKGCRITVKSENAEIKEITGYTCPKGKDYAKEEFLNPTRILPTTVKVNGGNFPLVSVKTAKPISKKLLMKAMEKTAEVQVQAPVSCGQVIIENLLDTGVDLIATRNVKAIDN